jgi:putative membrane protein
MLAAILLHIPDEFSWTEWRLYPDFMIGWLLFGGLYFLLIGPLRHRFPDSRPVAAIQVASFSLAMVIMLLALQGPMHELSDYYLFSVHMVQHLVLILVMPPFLLAGIPDWMLRPAVKIRPIGAAARWITFPVVAFLLNNFIFGFWHFPGPYDLMMRNHDVHVAMHLMIMVTGVIMWWPVLSPLPELPRIAPALQIVYLFVLGLPMMLAAALITFATTELYPWYHQAPRIFNISVLEDQRLGGAIMWVPGSLTLWVSISWAYFKWTKAEREAEAAAVEGTGEHPEGKRVVIAPPPFPQ